MVQPARLVEQTEKQGAYDLPGSLVAKSAHDAVRGADPLDFEHAAFARQVRLVQSFRNNSINSGQAAIQPPQGNAAIGRITRESDLLVAGEALDHVFKGASSRLERSISN